MYGRGRCRSPPSGGSTGQRERAGCLPDMRTPTRSSYGPLSACGHEMGRGRKVRLLPLDPGLGKTDYHQGRTLGARSAAVWAACLRRSRSRGGRRNPRPPQRFSRLMSDKATTDHNVIWDHCQLYVQDFCRSPFSRSKRLTESCKRYCNSAFVYEDMPNETSRGRAPTARLFVKSTMVDIYKPVGVSPEGLRLRYSFSKKPSNTSMAVS